MLDYVDNANMRKLMLMRVVLLLESKATELGMSWMLMMWALILGEKGVE